MINKDDRRASCPIVECDWNAQKIRNHVNRMHLPRVMWDNPNSPVKQNKYQRDSSTVPDTEDSGELVITRLAGLVYKQGNVVDPEESCNIGTPDRANEEPNNNDEMAAARVQ